MECSAVMHNYFPAVLVLFVVSGTIASNAHCAEGESERLKAEALRNWEKLESAGSRLQGSFLETQRIPQKPATLLKKGRFLVSGPSAWVLFQDPARLSSSKVALETVIGKNTRYAFSMRRKEDAGPFIVNYLGQPTADLVEFLTG